MEDIDDHRGNSSPSSLKQMLKSSLSCFGKNRSNHHHRRMSLFSDVVDTPRSFTRCSSAREKSSRSHDQGSEVKEKSKNFISRFSRHGRRHSASADFRYDALSYSLNFDEGDDESHDQFPLRNFSARLPASPPNASASATSAAREITAYS